jgi:hypothetical protein
LPPFSSPVGSSGSCVQRDIGNLPTICRPRSFPDQAWKIAMQVFRWEGADAIEEHRDQNMMLTSSGFNLLRAGTYMGAWVEPINANTTKVTCVTKRRIATNVATTLTETTFHERFRQAVEIVKSGKRLPIEPPP